MRKLAQFIALVFIFTIPWENAIAIKGLGSLTRMIGLAAAGLWLVSVMHQNWLRKIQFFHIVVYFFVLYNVMSLFWTVNYDLTMERVKTYIQIGILTLILWDLFTTQKSLKSAMQAFILGGYLAIVGAISNFLAGQPISPYEVGRYSGGGQNAVELALILSLSIPIAWHLAITQKAGHWANLLKIVNFAFIPAAFVTIILTASRTALIAIIPGVLYIFGTMPKIKPVYRFLVFITFIVVIFAGQSFIPNATLNRLGTIGYSIVNRDLGGRMLLWRESISIFKQNPLLGIGSGSLGAQDQLGSFAHNTFLSVLAELGITGFILFLGILALVIVQAIRQPKPNSVLWLTVLSIWTIGVLSLTWEFTKPTWFFLNLIIISGGIYNRYNLFIPDRDILANPRSSPGAAQAIPLWKDHS